MLHFALKTGYDNDEATDPFRQVSGSCGALGVTRRQDGSGDYSEAPTLSNTGEHTEMAGY